MQEINENWGKLEFITNKHMPGVCVCKDQFVVESWTSYFNLYAKLIPPTEPIKDKDQEDAPNECPKCGLRTRRFIIVYYEAFFFGVKKIVEKIEV